jgi:hypothetical protein
VAQRIARRVLDVAWTKQGDGHWRSQAQGPIDGSANDANPAGDGYNAYGMPLCVAVVLRADNADEKALAIWTAGKLNVPLATARQEIVTILKTL